jgi:hypothetical protein
LVNSEEVKLTTVPGMHLGPAFSSIWLF